MLRPIHAAKDFHAKLTFAGQRQHTTINGVNTVNVVNGTVNIEDFNVTRLNKAQYSRWLHHGLNVNHFNASSFKIKTKTST